MHDTPCLDVLTSPPGVAMGFGFIAMMAIVVWALPQSQHDRTKPLHNLGALRVGDWLWFFGGIALWVADTAFFACNFSAYVSPDDGRLLHPTSMAVLMWIWVAAMAAIGWGMFGARIRRNGWHTSPPAVTKRAHPNTPPV